MQYIPNSLSVLRILLSISLLFHPPFGARWLAVYIVCGATDFLDGFLARKWKICSQSGAMLDSIADFLMVTLVSYVIVRNYQLSLNVFVLLGAVSILKFTSLIVGFIRFRTLTLLHTYSNKFSGICVFILTPIYLLWKEGQFATLVLLSIITVFSALEELLIIVTATNFNPDQKSIRDNQI